jgi:2-oxoacid:acceptor oxidoreductase gamma subunit (pyruvate/2-ketoisovalerate family)
MIEIIFYGRGGQGAVTASQILATAAFSEGKYAQAFPSFGPERRGAPVMAFVRISEHPIVERTPIMKADYVIVLDPNLFKMSNPVQTLKETGSAILNLNRRPGDVLKEPLKEGNKIFCVDASAISDQVYGERSIPITNIPMLGAFASVSNIIQLNSLLDAVAKFFSGEEAEKAKRSARMAYEETEGVNV